MKEKKRLALPTWLTSKSHTWSEGNHAPFTERLLMPPFTVRGLSSGNVDKLARNVVPATASASIGMRLSRGNDPENMMNLVEKHILEQEYHITREDSDQDRCRARLFFQELISRCS